MLSPSCHVQQIAGSNVPVLYGPGALQRLGQAASERGVRRPLLVTDPGLEKAGHAHRALGSLQGAGLKAHVFDGVRENPTTEHVSQGLAAARAVEPDWIIALGGGSAMDCAKGINFLYSNGGEMADYWGVGKARRPMLPLMAIPTTAGTGSEAQSFALISDPRTHQKMACGDKKALPALAILDPELVATVPRRVAAATGIDAVAHAVETAGCARRTELSRRLSQQAWELLEGAFERALSHGDDGEARSRMLLGAHLAGAAIENSMLGAAHACANPLTARFGVPHGVAVGLMLPHVVRFNAADGINPYSDLDADARRLASRLQTLLGAAGLCHGLRELGVPDSAVDDLAELAAAQWTAGFNPRPVGAAELAEIYRAALR